MPPAPGGAGDRRAQGGWHAGVGGLAVVTTGWHEPGGTRRVPPTLLLGLPQRKAQDGGVKLRQGARPRFCGFFPQSWLEGEGPRVLLVQNPPGKEARERARASSGCLMAEGGTRGAQGTSWSCVVSAPATRPGDGGAFLGPRGGKKGQFRTETTYHPRSPVTNQGRKGDKVHLWGLCFSFSLHVPRAGDLSAAGAAGSGRDAPAATACPEETLLETLLLCGSALKKRVGAGGHLGEVGAVALCLQEGQGGTRSPLGREEGVLRTSLPPAAPPPGPCRRRSSHSGWWWPGARRACCRPRPRLVLPSRALGGCCTVAGTGAGCCCRCC